MKNKDKIISYLYDLIYHLVRLGKQGDKIKDIENLINELNKDEVEVVENKPPSVDSIIKKLLEQKKAIYDELTLKYKDFIIDEGLNLEQVVKLFNKNNEPDIMVRLFFLDMELENLGYNDK